MVVPAILGEACSTSTGPSLDILSSRSALEKRCFSSATPTGPHPAEPHTTQRRLRLCRTLAVTSNPGFLSTRIKRLLFEAFDCLKHRDPAFPAAVYVFLCFGGGHHHAVVGGAGEGLQNPQPALDVVG